MGRDRTFTYRVEVADVSLDGRRARWQAGWSVPQDGRPSDQRLESWVEQYEASTRPGNVNDHLGITSVTRASVVRQSTGEEVASYVAPMFKVIA